MASLEEQLVEAGNRLLHPPPSVDDLFILLDQVENFLSVVEQSPSESMRKALCLSAKALAANDFLRHPDVDVKVAVASCISEITRITAPDAPYDDDQMRDVLQLIVSSLENLSDKASKSYDKRILILETLAKVRTCMVMLDLECDELIAEMFQNFLKAIRDYHPDNVFSFMETIMTLVLEESEDISLELLLSILAVVKRDNQEVLPIARKLGERVFENCARKLQPYLIHAKKSMGFSFDDYSNVVASICYGKTGAVEHNDDNACRELMDQVNKENVIDAGPREDSVNRYLKVPSNSVAKTGNDHQSDQSVEPNVTSTAVPNDSNNGKSESKSEKTSKKRGRKSKSLRNSTEPADSSRVDSDTEAKRIGGRGKIRRMEVRTSHYEPVVEVAVPSEIEKEPMNITSPSPRGSVPDDGHPKKGRRSKKKDNLVQEVATFGDLSKKASEGTSDSKAEPQRRSGRRVPAGNVLQEKTIALADTSRTASDSKAKLLEQSGSKVDVRVRESIGDGSLSKKKEDEKRRGRGKSISEKDATQSSIKDDAKETVSSPKRTSRLVKDEGFLQETLKTLSKRKRKIGTEKASDTTEYGDNLIDAKVKVWWPDDEMFYEGVIHSFDYVKKKHKVLYADGDEEILNLRNERWEFVEVDSMPVQKQVTECRSPGPFPETHKKKKANTNFEPASQLGKMEGSRGGETSSSKLKGKATKSGRKFKDENKVDGQSKDNTSKSGANSDDSGDKPKDSSKKSSAKSVDASTTLGKSKAVDGTPKISSKSKQDTPENASKETPKAATKSKGKGSRIGNKSNVDRSGKVTLGKVKETKGKEKSLDMVKSKGVGGTLKTGTKSKQDTPKTATEDTTKAATKSKGTASKSGNKSGANGSGKLMLGKVKETTRKKKSLDMVKTPESMKGQETGDKGGRKRRREAKR